MDENKKTYNGLILSDSFLKRSFAIWGHYFVANIIIGFFIGFLVMLIVILFGISIPFLGSDKNIVDIVSSEELIE